MHYGFKYTSGGKGLVKLNKLENLDLSSNNLTDTHILEFLATLPALKSLSLADNYMEQPLLKSISNVLHCVCALYIIENEEGKGNTTHVHGS